MNSAFITLVDDTCQPSGEGVSFSSTTPSVTLTTDASLWGWGAHIESDCIGGPWPLALTKKHVNYLELLAIFWALMSFSRL